MTDCPYPVFTAENWPGTRPADIEGGVLILDKPLGWSSFRMVGLIRKLLDIRKVGHAGTLDPLATGILIVAFGKATKFIDLFQAEDKRYRACIRFGMSTPSYDSETEPDEFAPWDHITADDIDTVLKERFTGVVVQTPPIYSAIKLDGVPAYKKARIGEVPVLKGREVRIGPVRIESFTPPDLVLDIACAKGTYIRSLAHDLGLALRSRATLTGLIRTASGPWVVSSAISLSTLLTSLDPDGKTGLPR